MDPEDFNEITDSFNLRVRDSGNTTTNTATVGADLENVGNVDNSEDNSVDVGVEVVDSGNVDSHDQDWDIDDSFNSVHDESLNDNSVNAGLREYNTGFGDVHLAGDAGDAHYAAGAGGGGDVWINSESTILDQSVNQSILSGEGVEQGFANFSVAASGEGSIAAGDDVSISQSLDSSTNLSAEGDINMDNVVDVNVAVNSGNTFTDSSSDIDNSEEWDIEDSFNDDSTNVSFGDSFNEDFTSTETEDWDIDANVIWGSDDVAIADDVAVELPPV